MTKEYTSKDIQVLTDREHVHKRLAMYAGNVNPIDVNVPIFIGNNIAFQSFTFVPAVYKVVGEILDNSVDELIQINKKNKLIQIEANVNLGQYCISDNGRGVPIDKHETGKYTPELVFASLRAGRNFGETEVGVIGQNGMGSSITNFCSSQFNVTVHRDSCVYTQKFSQGASKISKPVIESGPKTKTGTTVEFTLDPTVFKNGVSIPEPLLHNRAIEIAFNNPGLTVEYQKQSYQFKNGLRDVVESISQDYYKFETQDYQFYIIFDKHQGIDELMYTWVNSSLLFDGGLCNTQFINALCDNVTQHLLPQAKKLKCEITKNDIRQNLLILATLKIANPEYDAQSKTRLTGPNLRNQIQDLIQSKWKLFVRDKKDWMETILQRAESRHRHANDKKVIKQLSQSKKKIPGLIDATSIYRHQCILTVTEGLSASSGISEVRDPATMATYPLTGKINNVYGCSPGEILKMTKVIGLIQAVGLIPGQPALRKDLNYGQIWIATDADPDGDDIASLLVNLFFSFWPELFDPNKPAFIKRLVAPNVVVYKGKERIHFTTRVAYEKQKDKYKTWSVDYYKGLGSMMEQDWNIILHSDDFKIPIVDNGNMKQTLSLLFDDKRADDRKEWLQ